MNKIIIAGGSGFLGNVLENYFTKKQYNVIILTRTPKRKNEVFWDAINLGKWTEELENAQILINLTGKSVDCRYTEKNKKEIYNSRINATKVLGTAINLSKSPPNLWLNSSTATIYKHSLEKEMTEENGDIGNDFSMKIAKSWENTFYSITNSNTRKIALRTSIVLGKNGGALTPLKKLTKLGLGGKHGSGKQKVSWIHELDFARAIHFLIQKDNLKGNFNLSVKSPTNNKTLMKKLREILKPPFGINHPIGLLKFGAKLIGTETELVLKSRNVIPKRLLDNGFKFTHDNLELALIDLLK